MQTEPKKNVLTIAGIDPTAQAGQFADCRTIEALGAHPCVITTALTAQNSQRLFSINPSTNQTLSSQWQAIESSLKLDAIKIGMIANNQQLQWLVDTLSNLEDQMPIVWDPVLRSSSEQDLGEPLEQELLLELLKRVTIVTPNLVELARLSELAIDSSDTKTWHSAAKQLIELGAQAVLVKGGHAANSEQSNDLLVTPTEYFWLHSPRQTSVYSRGTGCVLSSAIATALAKDHQQAHSLKDAVVIGKMAINQGLRQSYAANNVAIESATKFSDEIQKTGPLKVTHWPADERDMPSMSLLPDAPTIRFPDCDVSDGKNDLGLYPVVDRAQWLERLLPLGISTIQLRVKDLQGDALEQEIITAIAIAQRYKARLFINDYWQLAIQHGAYGVHLGQEDLDTADTQAIANSELRLGVSTHCYYEVARAHGIKPSYLACGPVYHTDSKQMPWIPHGIDNLRHWASTMKSYPWVGIGGISLDRIQAVMQAGVSGVAMISAITHADNPEAVAKDMMQLMAQKSDV